MKSASSFGAESRFDQGVEGLDPDHVTPVQFAGMLRSTTWRDGEHRLLAAVLQDAVETFHKCAFARTPDKRAQFEEVFRWINDTDTATLFSFQSICHVLDLDPDCLREGLLLWLREMGKRPVSIGARFLNDPRRQVNRFAAAS